MLTTCFFSMHQIDGITLDFSTEYTETPINDKEDPNDSFHINGLELAPTIASGSAEEEPEFAYEHESAPKNSSEDFIKPVQEEYFPGVEELPQFASSTHEAEQEGAEEQFLPKSDISDHPFENEDFAIPPEPESPENCTVQDSSLPETPEHFGGAEESTEHQEIVEGSFSEHLSQPESPQHFGGDFQLSESGDFSKGYFGEEHHHSDLPVLESASAPNPVEEFQLPSPSADHIQRASFIDHEEVELPPTELPPIELPPIPLIHVEENEEHADHLLEELGTPMNDKDFDVSTDNADVNMISDSNRFAVEQHEPVSYHHTTGEDSDALDFEHESLVNPSEHLDDMRSFVATSHGVTVNEVPVVPHGIPVIDDVEGNPNHAMMADQLEREVAEHAAKKKAFNEIKENLEKQK